MSSYVGARIRIKTTDGKYEGVLHSIDPVQRSISIKEAIALPDGQRYLGLLNFFGPEIEDLIVLKENELSSQPSSESQEQSQLPEARSYHDPQNPEIFDDYLQGNEQVNSYSGDWNYDPGPPYSEEVTIPNEPHENGPVMHSSDSSHQALCEGVNDLSLDPNMGSPQLQQPSPSSKPADTTVESSQKDYILISQHGALFDQAIAVMEEQTAIGLVLKGAKVGRKGKLSLVLVLCDKQVYMFDVLAIPSLFTRKFIDILQAVDITKVIHDCRFVSDLLYHHYGIQLNSVFDTQVGDILIKRREYMGDFPRKVSGTTESILEYLEVSIQELAMHLENTQLIEENESSWFQRPLPPANIRCALLDTQYLLRLREAITEQLMAEFTCAIDIYLGVERDRLDVDTKKLSARASYVPSELINNLHRKVSQKGISNATVKPKELSFPLPSSATHAQARGQPSHQRGSSGRGLSALRNQDTPWECKKSSPGRTGISPGHEPVRPPLMMNKVKTDEEEDNEESLSVTSEESDEAFADSTEKELWQQRYSQNIKPVTLKEALTAKEESEHFERGCHGTDASSALEDQRSWHQHPTSSTDKYTVPCRTVQNKSSVPGSGGNTETGENADRISGLPKDVSRAVGMTDHTYSQQPVSSSLPRSADSSQQDTSQRKSSAAPKRLSNLQQPQDTQIHPGSEQDRVSGQVSYADVLSGKKKEEKEFNRKAKRTLKTIGKLLASGKSFSNGKDGDDDDDDDDDEDDDDNDNDGIFDSNSKGNAHIGFDGYSSYGQGKSGFNSRNECSPEGASANQGPARNVGRGRASLVDHQSQVLNARQSQMQNRAPGGLGLRYAGRGRTVQVNFPTAEEMESAPESVPIAAGSTFVSQRAI